ncbi:MAG TPA: YlbF family regulator [Oscillospiraceae bacterium]|nr:YlbF family regulator [Oscillospiraceae bacterium]HNW04404.1 YlbF family regulator [Oscillospiraceae bacterium]
MDLIEMARELGKKLQEEETYLRLRTAQQAVEDDGQLQDRISEFNLQRAALGQEATKERRDQEKINALDKKVRDLYDELMEDAKLAAYNDAQDEFNEGYGFLMHILQMSAAGEDPMAVTKESMEQCGGECGDCGSCGSCDSCGGCH